MAHYVMDASAVLAFVLREGIDPVDAFFERLSDEDRLLGPFLLVAECTSAIHEQVSKGRMQSDEVSLYLERVLRLDIAVIHNPDQFRRAVELARQFGHAKAYDMQYLAAAISEDAVLVTIDGGMHQAAINVRHPVRFLR